MNKKFKMTDFCKQFTIGELTVFEKYLLPKLSLVYRSCSSMVYILINKSLFY